MSFTFKKVPSLLVAAALSALLVTPAAAKDVPITSCDTLATHPEDPDKVTAGVPRAKINRPEAIAACRQAVAEYPDTPRFKYQLSRVLFYDGQEKEGVERMRGAAETGYPQAEFVYGLFITNKRNFAPTDICLAERFWKASAHGGRHAATVNYVRFAEEGQFDKCGPLASKAEMKDLLAKARTAMTSYYERLLVDNLAQDLEKDQKLK
ncbi:hypothetical protein [Govanella unica]|uniref:Sel1 repeat family protein n=1 Tax=Govanella unica TaxID=2975056 RepID=A0A9X3TYW8_9PROT|nr:hypothetical protein [Govania unica]MDA5194247.1 hypothetical protein [Govania unica]